LCCCRHAAIASQQSLSLSPTCTQRLSVGGVPIASTPLCHLIDSGTLAFLADRVQSCWWPSPRTNGDSSTPPLTSTAIVVCSSMPQPPPGLRLVPVTGP